MKKILIAILVLACTHKAHSQIGATVMVAPYVKTSTTDTSKHPFGIDVNIFGGWKNFTYSFDYNADEKLLSLMVGAGKITISEKGSILWGLGPLVEITNSREYLQQKQVFLGGKTILSINRVDNYDLLIQSGVSVNFKRDNPYQKNVKKNDLHLLAVKHLKKIRLGVEFSYFQIKNGWPNHTVYGRFVPHIKTFFKIGLVLGLKTKFCSLDLVPFYQKTNRWYPAEDGWQTYYTKPYQFGLQILVTRKI